MPIGPAQHRLPPAHAGGAPCALGHPDVVGAVVRDGVTLGYEVFGDPSADDRPTILLLPTWTIIHARFWKLQVPYLARHFPVVVYDGPGNGRSDRTTDPARYTVDAYAADAAAVLDACGVERAVVVGLSRGARVRGRARRRCGPSSSPGSC